MPTTPAAKKPAASKKPAKGSRFSPPSEEEVKQYATEINFEKLINDPGSFIDYYEQSGWKLKGGGTMKSWKASVRNWKRTEASQGESNPKATSVHQLGVIRDQLQAELTGLQRKKKTATDELALMDQCQEMGDEPAENEEERRQACANMIRVCDIKISEVADKLQATKRKIAEAR